MRTDAPHGSRPADAGARCLVLASLPYLPRFDLARRLPVGRETLAARLALLAPPDAAEIALAVSFLSWQRYPADRTDEEVIREHDCVLAAARTAALRELVAFRLGVRTLVAALRRKHLGLPAPRTNERWGVGRWTRHVARRYAEPDFGLGHVLPWLPAARPLLEVGDAVGLERLLFGLVWDELERLTRVDRLGFGAVLAYVFKWDLVDRWLRRDAALAARRLDALAMEALGAFDHPFAAHA